MSRGVATSIALAVVIFVALSASRIARADVDFRPALIVSTVVTALVSALVILAVIHLYSRPVRRLNAKLHAQLPGARIYFSLVNSDAKTALASLGETARRGTYFATVVTADGIELWVNWREPRRILDLPSASIQSLEPARAPAAGQRLAAVMLRFVVNGRRFTWPLLLAQMRWAGPSELDDSAIRAFVNETSQLWTRSLTSDR